jgi:YD repeat-containing protein
MVTQFSPQPINFRTASGAWTPIDNTLVQKGGGFLNRAGSDAVALPRTLSNPVSVSSSSGTVSFLLVGANHVARTVAGATATYRNVLAGTTAVYKPTSTGVTEKLHLDGLSAPKAISFDLWTSTAEATALRTGVERSQLASARGRSALRLALTKAGAILVSSPTGRPAFTVPALTAYPAGRPSLARAVKISLTRADSGWRLRVDTNEPWLRRELTRGPVVVDPSVADTEPTYTCDVDDADGGAECGSGDSGAGLVGPDDPNYNPCPYCNAVHNDDDDSGQAVLLSQYNLSAIPAGSIVNSAQLSANVQPGPNDNGDEAEIFVAASAQPWVYNNAADVNPDAIDTYGNSVGAYGYNGEDSWDVTYLVQEWVNGSSPNTAPNTGSADAKADNGFLMEAVDNQVDVTPETLQVTWTPNGGPRAGANQTVSQPITSSSTAGVNVSNGNLEVSSQDSEIAAVAGLDPQIGRNYNSEAEPTNPFKSFGTGWTMSLGADTTFSSCFLDYADGSGVETYFPPSPSASTRTYTAPAQDLYLTDNNVPQSATQFTVLERHSGTTETFNAPAGCGYKRLSTVTNRDGDMISYSYNASNQLTAITNTPQGGQTRSDYTVAYNTAGYISEISSSDGRNYFYWQNTAGQLIKYEDPDGNYTYYTYNTAGNLSQIQDPDTNAIQVNYDGSSRVSSVERFANPGDSTGPTTTFSYGSPDGTHCPTSTVLDQTAVTDANSHTTYYCSNSADQILQVVDPLVCRWFN